MRGAQFLREERDPQLLQVPPDCPERRGRGHRGRHCVQGRTVLGLEVVDGLHGHGVALQVAGELVQQGVDPGQVAGQVLQGLPPGASHEAGVDEPVHLLRHVRERGHRAQ